MSSYIKVDHNQLESAAAKIESCITGHNKYLSEAGSKVVAMGSDWSGMDYIQYQIQWNNLTENGSTSKNITTAMQNYADILRYSANQYKEAQSKAVNSANSIPSW